MCALNALNKEILAAISKDERSGPYQDEQELSRLLGESKVCTYTGCVCFFFHGGSTHQSKVKNSFDGLSF